MLRARQADVRIMFDQNDSKVIRTSTSVLAP
jgi:hypothetical protein